MAFLVRHTCSSSFKEKIHQLPNVKLACASRTGAVDIANELLILLNWNDLFDYKEIYPGSKVTHFGKFHKLSNISYNEMIFFDDEYRNIDDLTKLGVHSHLAENGMSWALLEQALIQYNERLTK